jgi:hypothetical protein
MTSYLAVTAHWIALDATNGRLELRAALIGFRHLKKEHTGVNIATVILEVLDRADVTSKVCTPHEIHLLASLIPYLDRPLHARQRCEQCSRNAKAAI